MPSYHLCSVHNHALVLELCQVCGIQATKGHDMQHTAEFYCCGAQHRSSHVHVLANKTPRSNQSILSLTGSLVWLDCAGHLFPYFSSRSCSFTVAISQQSPSNHNYIGNYNDLIGALVRLWRRNTRQGHATPSNRCARGTIVRRSW